MTTLTLGFRNNMFRDEFYHVLEFTHDGFEGELINVCKELDNEINNMDMIDYLEDPDMFITIFIYIAYNYFINKFYSNSPWSPSWLRLSKSTNEIKNIDYLFEIDFKTNEWILKRMNDNKVIYKIQL